MTFLEFVPYDYIPYTVNIDQKKVFDLSIHIDFLMLLKIFSNLEHPFMKNYKELLSKFLYGKEINYYASIVNDVEEKTTIFESQFLENILMEIYKKESLEKINEPKNERGILIH